MMLAFSLFIGSYFIAARHPGRKRAEVLFASTGCSAQVGPDPASSLHTSMRWPGG